MNKVLVVDIFVAFAELQVPIYVEVDLILIRFCYNDMLVFRSFRKNYAVAIKVLLRIASPIFGILKACYQALPVSCCKKKLRNGSAGMLIWNPGKNTGLETAAVAKPFNV